MHAISIDIQSTTPIHRQIYEAWRNGILRGRFACKTQVPSTRELASSLAVSRSTVTQAYDQLIAEGYLQSVRGSGTFVCHALPERLLYAKATSRHQTESAPILPLSTFGMRLQDHHSYPSKQAGSISFAHWTPDQTKFPFTTWRRLTMRHLRHTTPEIFHYAQDVQGYKPLRDEISKYVSRARAVVCAPEQIIILNGSQQALDLCARLLLNAGDEIAIENPGYLGARRIFSACGAKLRPVRIDAEGIVCSDLGKNARAVYVTPSHQFPTGVAMSLLRRFELIAWARKHHATIIEDDYDSEYRYSGAPLPALQGLSQSVSIIYCGTFSKVMYPGLRVGYVVVPHNLIAPFRRAKWLADRNTSMLEQCALADFLREGHFERHIRRMRRLYASRRLALVESLNQYFGKRAEIVGDQAGMHALVRIQDKKLIERATHKKVQLRAAAEYYLVNPQPHEYLFGFASLSERVIREGVKRLAT